MAALKTQTEPQNKIKKSTTQGKYGGSQKRKILRLLFKKNQKIGKMADQNEEI